MNWWDKLKGKVGRNILATAKAGPQVWPRREERGTVLRPQSPLASPDSPERIRVAEVRTDGAWKVGDVILNLYEVKRIHLGGGMGFVYRVHHRGWNTDLAVKSPRPEYFQTQADKDNFTRECETWISLGLHPHVVSCYYVRAVDGMPRVFAEYVEGGSLHDWIESRRLYDGGPREALKRILDIAIQMAWGLHYAHEQDLIHQDVKPANVMLTPDGTAKITDFGLAKARAASGQSVAVAGGRTVLVSSGGMTPAYCSPEQARFESLSRKTDMWSWAVSVLEMFTGGVTWQFGCEAPDVARGLARNRSRSIGVPDMPAQLLELLEQCFAEEPRCRPTDFRAVADMIISKYREIELGDYPRGSPERADSRADGLNNRAVSMLDLGRAAEAERLFDQVLEMHPDHPQGVFNRGLHLWRTGRQTDVTFIRRLEELQRFRPADWNVPYFLGLIHLERQDTDRAINALTSAKELNGSPEIPKALAEAKRYGPHAVRCLKTFEKVWAVRSLAMSADGRLVLSGGETKLGLWEVSTGKCLNSFEGHTDAVTSVVFGPDGYWALSGSRDGTIRKWDVSSGKCLKTLGGGRRGVWAVALSADGITALSSEGQTLLLWDVSSGRFVRLIDAGSHVTSVALNADGSRALSGGARLRLWDVTNGTCLKNFEGHIDQVNAVVLCGESRLALSGSGFHGSADQDNTLRLWDIDAGSCLRTIRGHEGPVESVALSKDGRWAVSGGGLPDDNTLRFWDVTSGKCLRTVPLGRIVSSVVLSMDNRLALSADYNDDLRLWDVSGMFDRLQIFNAPWALSQLADTKKTLAIQKRFQALLETAAKAFSERDFAGAWSSAVESRAVDGYQFSAEALDTAHQAGLHGRRTGLRNVWCRQTIKQTGVVGAVALSADGRIAVSASSNTGNEGKLRLWDTSSGRCLRMFGEFKEAAYADPVPVILSADGGWVLAGDMSGAILFWETASDTCVKIGRHFHPRSLALSADRRWVLSAGLGETIDLWEVGRATSARELEGHKTSVNSVALSADARWALSGGCDNTLRLWELSSGRCLKIIEGHKHFVERVVLSRDGRLALSIESVGRNFWLWDLDSGICLRIFEGHSNSVTSIAVSPDGRWAMSGSYDRTLRLWEVSTGKCVRTFQEHTDCVTSVAFSEDGRWALSGSRDQTLRLWELEWDYEFPEETDWDERARSYLENFLTLNTPYVSTDPDHPEFLLRRGRPVWDDSAWLELLRNLQYGGYGWLRHDGVRRELERMTASWQGPPPLPWAATPGQE